jgi:small subunit ribosomal protein S14
MAKKSSVAREKKRAHMCQVNWDKRQGLKKIILDMGKSDEERMAAVNLLNEMPRNSSPVRKRNRCLMTGRSRGYLRKFKLSRLCFRELARQGYIPGVVKASW